MLTENNEYRELIENIKTKVKAAQYRVMSQANAELIFMYREIGLMLNEKTQYGTSFIDTLAKELKIDNPEIKGFSARNLRYMKKFAKEITDEEFLQTVSAKLTWSHNIVLLDKLKDMKSRKWYGQKTIQVYHYIMRLSINFDTI